MTYPWEETYDTETEQEGPWTEFGSVIRDAVPGSLSPPDLVPAVRKIGGELAIGEPGDTHPDIIDRDKIPAKDIDQRGFVGPWDEFYDRESAAQATQLPTALEPGRLHSTDLIKAAKEPPIVAPTFETPVSITEEGPLYKREQEEAAKAAALYAPPTPVQPPSLAPVREAQVPKLFRPEQVPGAGIPLTAAEKALGPSEETKKNEAQLEIYRQAVDLASKQAQRDLTNAELAQLGENAARAVDFFGAIGRTAAGAGEATAGVLYGQGLNRIAEDVAAGDLNFPRFRSSVARTKEGVGFSPLEKGAVELATIAPDIAITSLGQAAGIPAPVTFGALSASRAYAEGATPEQVILAGATGAAAPYSGQIGTKGAALILKGAINRGLLSANRETALKVLESLGGQAGFQTFFAGMSLPEIAALPPEKRWDFIAEQGIKNLAFSALDIPKFRRGVPSETRNALVSDFLDMMAKQGPMGSVLKAPAERGVPVSLGTEAEAKVPVSAKPETISSNLGLEFLGTTKTTDRYVYNGINPRTGRPAGITVSVPQGTGERGVSEKMKSRLAEYEMTPPTEAEPTPALRGRIAPEAITETNVEQISSTEPNRLTHTSGIEYGINLSEADVPRLEQKYNAAQKGMTDAARAGDDSKMLAEFGKSNFYGGALQGATKGKHPAAAGNYAYWLERQSKVPEGALSAKRGFTRIVSKPYSDVEIRQQLRSRHKVAEKNPLVEVIENPDTSYLGEFNPKTGKIQINRLAIDKPELLDWVWEHERAHLADVKNPGIVRTLWDTINTNESKKIDTEVIDSGYRATEFSVERDARAITTLANAWRGRSWFDRMVKTVQQWFKKQGSPMSRAAAERTAARMMAESTKSIQSEKWVPKRIGAEETMRGMSKEKPEEPSPVGERAMGAAAPEEFPQPEPVRAFSQFDGWVGRAKDALQRVKEYFTPPQVGELPEVEIQSGAVLPRLPDYAKEKTIASAPHGMAKVPGLGAIFDSRAVAHTPADAAFLARANSVSKGKTFAAMWAQTQWRNKDLFKVDENPGPNQGTFRLANGQRGYLSDVIEAELADPGSQPITHAQWQWIHNEWKPILDEIRRQLHNEGVSRIATEDMDFDLSTDYFPRPAIGKRTRATTGAGGRPAGRPGAKQFFQKSRLYETEQEGARPGTVRGEKEEIIYDPDPISRVSKFIAGSYRAIADHRLANDPALGAGTVPDYWGVGRQTMAGPAFAGKTYPVEVAQKIERQFAQDIRGWVRATGNVTSAAKALMATADVSAPFIQGAAMFGRNPIRWARSTVNSYRALTDPNFVAKLMEHPRYKELAEGYSQSGGSLLQLQDFLRGLEPGQIATRIPGYGRFLTATGRSYGAFLDLAKLELFDAWKRVTPQSELPRLVETIENSLFMGRMEQAGMNPHRAIGERLLFFAPSYYRGAAGLMATAFQKGVSGKMARQMLGGYAAASMLVTMSAYLAMGMDWDEIQQRLRPGRGKFLKVPINLGDGERVEVGMGNILTQLVRLGGQAANYHTSDKPIDTGVEANPYLRFLRVRSAFIPGVAIELATGRDYFGKRISAKESLARHFSPFVFQSMFPRDEASFRQRAGDAAFTFFGLNAYAESEYEKARNAMDQTARRVSGKPFSQLNVAQRAKVVDQFKRSPEYKKREPSPTDMERIININAERQSKLQQSLGDSADKLARMGLRVPGYRSTFQYKGVAVPMTEKERERYQEILSGLYKSQIGKLNEDSVLKRPLPEREKWWSGQAEKIGIEARKRLAAEISANKVK